VSPFFDVKVKDGNGTFSSTQSIIGEAKTYRTSTGNPLTAHTSMGKPLQTF